MSPEAASVTLDTVTPSTDSTPASWSCAALLESVGGVLAVVVAVSGIPLDVVVPVMQASAQATAEGLDASQAPMSDAWIARVQQLPQLSDPGRVFLAQRQAEGRALSVRDAIDWLALEERIGQLAGGEWPEIGVFGAPPSKASLDRFLDDVWSEEEADETGR